MKYCNKCRVRVNSPVARCPLCYATLAREDANPEPPSYPDTATFAEHYNILLRLLLLLSFSVSIACFTINALTYRHVWWSLIVIVLILYMWFSISTAVRRRRKLGYNVMIQGLSLAVLLAVLDRLLPTRGNWTFDYVLPALFFCATLSITVIVIVRRMAIRDFILYFILTALLGFIPILLMAVGLVKVLWPSLVSALYSLVSLVSLFILADNATKIELKKRFHI